MIPPKKPQQEDQNVDSWLMSYADMITLLLCFFIIFVSVSEPRKEKLSKVTEGMAAKFGALELATPFQAVFRSLQEVLEKRQILQDVAIERHADGLDIELSGGAFFQPQSAEIAPDMQPALDEMFNALRNIDSLNYTVVVEGYTNDLPISTPSYPSNWELSSARATRIVRYFIEKGIKPERLKAVGYGATQPKVPNLDTNGNAIVANRKQNERVLIKLEQN